MPSRNLSKKHIIMVPRKSSQSKHSLLILNIILRVLLALKEDKAYIKASQVAGAVVKNLPAIQETQVCFLDWEDPLELEMATHSRILAWKIPWTEKCGRQTSIGWQTAGHEWATELVQKNLTLLKNVWVILNTHATESQISPHLRWDFTSLESHTQIILCSFISFLFSKAVTQILEVAVTQVVHTQVLLSACCVTF